MAVSERKFPPAPDASNSGPFPCQFAFSKESHRDLAKRFAILIETDIPPITNELTAAVQIAELHPALKKGPDSEKTPPPIVRAKGAS